MSKITSCGNVTKATELEQQRKEDTRKVLVPLPMRLPWYLTLLLPIVLPAEIGGVWCGVVSTVEIFPARYETAR
jgi:hypothetical protein